MYLLYKGHKIKKDLEELIRLAFNEEELIYIDGFKDYKEGYLLYNILYEGPDGYRVLSKLFYNSREVGRSSKALDDVNVYIDSFKKKLNVAIKNTIYDLSPRKDNIYWGILTGIRPLKIVHKLRDRELDSKEIYRVLSQEYRLRPEKIDRLLEIEDRQRAYIRENENRYSIYVSIPFCPTTCAYCSFPSMPIGDKRDQVEGYIDSLIYEIEETARQLDRTRVNTIYIGGGTPSSIEGQQLARIIKSLKELFPAAVEFTVEAGRPDTLDYDYLKLLRELEVDRISINPQTMNDETLAIIGREHTTEDVRKIYRQARELGFKSINMDLIVGLPGEDLSMIEKSFDEIARLDPDNLTVHTLAIKTGSRFKGLMDNYKSVDEKDIDGLNEIIDSYTARHKLKPYYLYRQKRSLAGLENVGYSREDTVCKYNISMMEERETVYGFGLGAVSKIYREGSIERVPNFKGLRDYMERIDELVLRKLED